MEIDELACHVDFFRCLCILILQLVRMHLHDSSFKIRK